MNLNIVSSAGCQIWKDDAAPTRGTRSTTTTRLDHFILYFTFFSILYNGLTFWNAIRIVLYILKETAATPLTPQPPQRKRGSKKRNKNSEMNSIYRGQKGKNVWNKIMCPTQSLNLKCYLFHNCKVLYLLKQ